MRNYIAIAIGIATLWTTMWLGMDALFGGVMPRDYYITEWILTAGAFWTGTWWVRNA